MLHNIIRLLSISELHLLKNVACCCWQWVLGDRVCRLDIQNNELKEAKMLCRAEKSLGVVFAVGLWLWAIPFTLHIVIWSIVEKKILIRAASHFYCWNIHQFSLKKIIFFGNQENGKSAPQSFVNNCRNTDASPGAHRPAPGASVIVSLSYNNPPHLFSFVALFEQYTSNGKLKSMEVFFSACPWLVGIACDVMTDDVRPRPRWMRELFSFSVSVRLQRRQPVLKLVLP